LADFICKPVFFGGLLQPIFFPWVLDLIVISKWLLRPSKPCLSRMFAGVLFLYHLFSAIFKLQQAAGDQRKKMTDLIFLCTLMF
jgi:hypothetical protein